MEHMNKLINSNDVTSVYCHADIWGPVRVLTSTEATVVDAPSTVCRPCDTLATLWQ